MTSHGQYVKASEVLTAYREGERDFSDCKDLYGEHFSGENLAGADFSRSLLDGGDFTGAILRDARFRDADIEDTSFDDADCAGADFVGANFDTRNLTIIMEILRQAADRSPDLDLLESTDRDTQSDRFLLVKALRDENGGLCWASTPLYAIENQLEDALRWALDVLDQWECLKYNVRLARRRFKSMV